MTVLWKTEAHLLNRAATERKPLRAFTLRSTSFLRAYRSRWKPVGVPQGHGVGGGPVGPGARGSCAGYACVQVMAVSVGTVRLVPAEVIRARPRVPKGWPRDTDVLQNRDEGVAPLSRCDQAGQADSRLPDVAVPVPCPQEFRDDVVRVARNREKGVPLAQIEKDFGVTG